MAKQRKRKDKTHYIVTSNFSGSEAEIQQLLRAIKQLIKSREGNPRGT